MNKYCVKCHKTTKFTINGLTWTCGSCYTVMEMVAAPTRLMIGNPYNCRYSFEKE